MRPIEKLLDRLDRLGCSPRRRGAGWQALCPAHEADGAKHDPSLSVAEAQDGAVLLRCFAGCETKFILDRLGLAWADLWPDGHRPANDDIPTSRAVATACPNSASRSAKPSSTASPPAKTTASPPPPGNGQGGKATYPSAEAAIAQLERSMGKPAARWEYVDAQGHLVGLVVRWDLPQGGKDIRPIARLSDGQWAITAMPEPRPLYRLPDILKADPQTPVIVCEGEKTAEAAAQCGLLATTSSGGAQAAAKTDWTPLAGRNVIVLPDHDEPGRRYADTAARLALEAGAASVKIVYLADYCPELPETGDLADILADPAWCGCGLGDAAMPEDLGRLILQWAAEAPTVEEQSEADGQPIPDWQPFPLDALPEPFRRFSREAAEALQVDPASVALSLLTVAASAIGGSRRLAAKDGWNVPSILWTAILQPSGSLKSPVRRTIFRWTKERQEMLFRQYRLERERYEADLAEYEKQRREWLRDGESLPPPEKPKEPAQHRVWVQDITIEKVAALLAQNPRGFLLAADELGAWFGSFDRYARTRGADVNLWLPLYNGEEVLVDRKTGENIYARHGYLSILGYIVPETFRRICGPQYLENGLVARFLLVNPPPMVKQWTEAAVNDSICHPVGEALGRLYDLELASAEDGELTYRLMRLGDKAKKEYEQFYNNHNLELACLTGPLQAAFSKLEELPLRLAIVIHLVRWASGEAVDPDKVDWESMTAAITITQWQKRETTRIYRLLFSGGGQGPSDGGLGELVQWIADRGGAVTVRDLTHYHSRYKNKPSEAEADLNDLACRGFGRWENRPASQKGGRPTRIFRLISVSPNLQNPLKSEKKEVLEIWRYGDDTKTRPEGPKPKSKYPPKDVIPVVGVNRILPEAADDDILALENG